MQFADFLPGIYMHFFSTGTIGYAKRHVGGRKGHIKAAKSVTIFDVELYDHLCIIGQGAIAWVFLPGTCAHFGRAVSLFYLPRRSANSFIKSPSLHRC